MNIVDKILHEAVGSYPNKEFSFEDMNGNTVDAVIGTPGGQSKGSVVVGYQFNGSARHDENNETPDARNLFYILGRVTKFVINYVNQYKPLTVIIQSDNESGTAAEKRINIYKGIVDKYVSSIGYTSKVSRNAHGYYIALTRS